MKAQNKGLPQSRPSKILWWSTLQWKISCVIGLIVILVSIFDVLFYIDYLKAVADSEDQKLLASVATDIAERFQPLLDSESSYADLQQAALDIISVNPLLEIYLIDESGKLLATFADQTTIMFRELPLDPVHQFLNENARIFPILSKSFANSFEEPARIFSAAPVTIHGRPGYVYVILRALFFDQAFIVAGEDSLIIYSVLHILAQTIIVTILALYTVRILLRKFAKVTAVLQEFQSGNLSLRLEDEGQDEVSQLSVALNEMANKIETSMTELEKRDSLRRELIANVAHDLRDPVASIKAESLRLSVRNEINLNKEKVSLIGDRITRTADSLAHVLNELFELAKLEAHEIKPNFIIFAVDELIEDLLDYFQPIASKKGVTIRLEEREGSALVLGDTLMLSRILMKVLEYALNKSESNTGIYIACVLASEEKVRITVSYKRDITIFQSEVDDCRDGTDYFMSENGLGAAIVKRMLELHGSSFEEVSKSGGVTLQSFELARGNYAL